jgi:GT2 family glycosyltransferase
VLFRSSKDDTRAILESYAARHPWIRVISRGDRGARVLGGGVIEAFNAGLAALAYRDYRYLAKLDGDMSFSPRYLEIMFEAFAADPKLACVCGKVFRPEGERLVEEHISDESTCGQFKLYRREAFEAIGGFVSAVLWDGIDWHRCRMLGWNTKSFHHPEARLFHHRLMGSSDHNVLRGRRRLGRAMWFAGYHPLYAISAALFRMHEVPRITGGLMMIYGYLAAALKRAPRYPDPAFRRYLQRWQWSQLFSKLRSGR